MRKMNHKRVISSLLLSASIISSTAYAQTPPPANEAGENAAAVAAGQPVRAVNPDSKNAIRVAKSSADTVAWGIFGLGLGALGLLIANSDSGASGAVASNASRDPFPGNNSGISTIIERDGVASKTLVDLIRNEEKADADYVASIRNSVSYIRNPAKVQGNFANKLGLGLTGQGVSIGVYDTGIDWRNAGLKNTLRGEGLWTYAGADMNVMRHGTSVAWVIAGNNFDNRNIGIAPGVTIHDLAITPEVKERNTITPIEGSRYRGAMDYIVDKKLDIVNMSIWIGAPELDTIQDYTRTVLGHTLSGYQEATNNGTIFVVSAGNYGNTPSNNIFAAIGLEEELNNQLITVYALRPDGKEMMGFSNTCGEAFKNFCIGAVGAGIPIIDMNGNETSFAGTSAAAPVVSAALALLREQHPELSSKELVELVLFTAKDMGAPGVDAVYGRGALNMDAALVPVGKLRIVNGGVVRSQAIEGKALSINIGNEMAGLASVLDGQVAVAVDDFNRGFEIAAENLVDLNETSIDPLAKAAIDLTFGAGGRLRIADEDGVYLTTPTGLGFGYARPEMTLDQDGFVMKRGYTPLAYLDRGPVVTAKFGDFNLGASYETDDAKSAAIWARHDVDLGRTQLSWGGGLAKQNEKMLGTDFGTGSSVTGWVNLSASWDLGTNLALISDFTAGKSRYKGDAIFREVTSDLYAARIGLSHDDVFGGTLTGTIGAPLTGKNGKARADLPGEREASNRTDATEGLERNVIEQGFSNRFPVDLGVSYSRDVDRNGSLEIGAVRRFNSEGRNESFLGARVGFRF